MLAMKEDDICTNCNNNNNNNNNKNRIVVDEEEPEVDVDETPFDARTVTIRRDKRLADEFEIVDFLGRGRFGEVKRCRELTTGREFAAKFIVTPKPKDRDDVLHEVNIMRKLQNCRRLVQLYDVFETKKDMCLVLEIIYGGELFDRAVSDDFVLIEKACVCFVRQICEGIAFMHSKNIVHLDMKPENILCLSRNGNRIKIIDFGLAREYDPTVETRVMYGTPEFMAPEVVQFDPIDFATDMWSVGVICYVLLSGLSPFMGDSDSETMSNVSKGRFEFHSPEFDEISSEAKDLIANLLQADKRNRLTASECLNHQWLRPKYAAQSPSTSLKLSKEHLRRFVYRRKWQKAVHAIVALKRMGVDLKSLKSSVASPMSLSVACPPRRETLDGDVSMHRHPPTEHEAAVTVPVPPKRRHRTTGNGQATDMAVSSSVGGALVHQMPADVGNGKGDDDDRLEQRHLPVNDYTNSAAATQHRIISNSASDTLLSCKADTVHPLHRLHVNSNRSVGDGGTKCRDELKPSSTNSLNNCTMCNGRPVHQLQIDATPTPPPPSAPVRSSGLHRRLNAVVRDRIIFFSKKEQPRKSKSKTS
jgi:myosin-light-chain kinase